MQLPYALWRDLEDLGCVGGEDLVGRDVHDLEDIEVPSGWGGGNNGRLIPARVMYLGTVSAEFSGSV